VTTLVTTNLALKFMLELAGVAAYAYTAFRLVPHPIWRVVAAILAPLLVVVIWSAFMAPNSDTRLNAPWRVIAELTVFLGAAVLLWLADLRVPALVYGATAALCELLSVLLEPNHGGGS